MASLNLTIDTTSGWDSSSKRTINLSISSDYGSGSASYSIRSSSSSSSYPYTRIWLYVNGQLVHDSDYGTDYRYYPMSKDATHTGTCSCPATGSILVELKAGVGYNYVTDQTSGYLTKIGTPSISTPSITDIGRTSAKASASMTDAAGGSQTDFYIDCGTSNFGNVVSTISSTSGTFTGLSPNTLYYVRANGSNGSYRGYSTVTSFRTTGNPPTIGARTITQTYESSAINSKVSAEITYSTTYDSSSFGSHSLVYGTTTSYGSSATSGGTGANSKFTLNNLLPNTTYFYKITETDRDSLNSTVTGSFTTKTRVKIIEADGTVKPAKVQII